MVHIDMDKEVPGQYSKLQGPKKWERGGEEERKYALFGPITLKTDLSLLNLLQMSTGFMKVYSEGIESSRVVKVQPEIRSRD
jgi:hypothetical protein